MQILRKEEVKLKSNQRVCECVCSVSQNKFVSVQIDLSVFEVDIKISQHNGIVTAICRIFTQMCWIPIDAVFNLFQFV